MSRWERYLATHHRLVWPLIVAIAVAATALILDYLTSGGSPWLLIFGALFITAWTFDEYRRRKANR